MTSIQKKKSQTNKDNELPTNNQQHNITINNELIIIKKQTPITINN